MEIDNIISSHIAESDTDADEIYWMQQYLLRDGYLKIRNVVPDTLKKRIADEAYYLLETMSKRRDIYLEVTDNSPRFMSNVRQQDIAAYNSVIPAVYHSHALIDFLSLLGREEIIANPWEYEKFIINRQEKMGDTHGWHWGDYPYSVIWIIEVPDVSYGDLLEAVPHTHWNKNKPMVNEHLIRNPIHTKAHVNGDVYILKSDTTLHRVTPLVKDATRVIINMAWERARDKDREVTHETFAFRE